MSSLEAAAVVTGRSLLALETKTVRREGKGLNASEQGWKTFKEGRVEVERERDGWWMDG